MKFVSFKYVSSNGYDQNQLVFLFLINNMKLEDLVKSWKTPKWVDPSIVKKIKFAGFSFRMMESEIMKDAEKAIILKPGETLELPESSSASTTCLSGYTTKDYEISHVARYRHDGKVYICHFARVPISGKDRKSVV